MPAQRALTPGSYDPAVTLAQVQQHGFSATRRPTLWAALKLKRQAMVRYGITPLTNWHRYTLDHLVPLSLGGSPTADTNLWPEPKAEAKAKDRDEAHWLAMVRGGGATLADAQHFFPAAMVGMNARGGFPRRPGDGGSGTPGLAALMVGIALIFVGTVLLVVVAFYG